MNQVFLYFLFHQSLMHLNSTPYNLLYSIHHQSLIFEGNRYNGNQTDDYDGDGNDLNIQVKRLKLNDECILNDFDISLFLNLEELIIGNDCFQSVEIIEKNHAIIININE